MAKTSNPGNAAAARRDAQIAFFLSVDRLLDAAEKARQERERLLNLIRDEASRGIAEAPPR